MEQILFIGTSKEANVFNALGFKTYICHNEKELIKLANEEFKDAKLVLYDSKFKDFFAEYKNKRTKDLPLLVLLPLSNEDMGLQVTSMKEKIKKSIGIDLL